jgi:hypothetical protein
MIGKEYAEGYAVLQAWKCVYLFPDNKKNTRKECLIP